VVHGAPVADAPFGLGEDPSVPDQRCDQISPIPQFQLIAQVERDDRLVRVLGRVPWQGKASFGKPGRILLQAYPRLEPGEVQTVMALLASSPSSWLEKQRFTTSRTVASQGPGGDDEEGQRQPGQELPTPVVHGSIVSSRRRLERI